MANKSIDCQSLLCYDFAWNGNILTRTNGARNIMKCSAALVIQFLGGIKVNNGFACFIREVSLERREDRIILFSFFI